MRKAINEKLTYFKDDELKKVHDDTERRCKSLVNISSYRIDKIMEIEFFLIASLQPNQKLVEQF